MLWRLLYLHCSSGLTTRRGVLPAPTDQTGATARPSPEEARNVQPAVHVDRVPPNFRHRGDRSDDGGCRDTTSTRAGGARHARWQRHRHQRCRHAGRDRHHHDVNTNVGRTAVTNESGNYNFSSLLSGTYRVEAELQGFRKYVREGVEVDVNTTVRVDIPLEVGQLAEQVTVTAETPALQTDRTDTGRIIEGKQVQEMPLAFNRNFQGMLVTVPGATRPFRPHSQFFNSQDSLSTQVNGQSRLANNVQIEGLDNNHRTGLLTVLIPPPDALETVSVTTSNYDAEFGRSGGAVTNVTLKSGTNDFKGSAFFYGNNEKTNAQRLLLALDAAGRSSRRAASRSAARSSRNKLFFFGDYQRTIDNLGYVFRGVVPTMAMRGGDFSAARRGSTIRSTGRRQRLGPHAVPGQHHPADRISPIARRLLANIPAPNIPGAALGQNNYQKSQVREKTTDGFDTKFNYSLNGKNQIRYRFSFQRPGGVRSGPVRHLRRAGQRRLRRHGHERHSTARRRTGRASSARADHGRARRHELLPQRRRPEGAGLTTSADLGIPGANIDDWTPASRVHDQQRLHNPLVGFANSLPWDRSERTWNVAATLTKLQGNHTIKFGGEWRHNRDFLLQTQDAGGPRGEFVFGAGGHGPARRQPEPRRPRQLVRGVSARLAEHACGATCGARPGTKHWATFAFVHDKWQLRPNLTLDLGLRWEFYTPLVGLEDKGGLSNYDVATNTLRVAGYGSTGQRPQREEQLQALQPAHRDLVAHQREDGRPRRLRCQHDSVPRQPLRVQLPVKQTNVLNSVEPVPARWHDGRGIPGPVFVEHPG